MDYKEAVLNEREKSHGDYDHTAEIAQDLKSIVRANDNGKLNSVMAESLDLICTKMARILSGDAYEPDHYKDIAGYAKLVEERLTKQVEERLTKQLDKPLTDVVHSISPAPTPFTTMISSTTDNE